MKKYFVPGILMFLIFSCSSFQKNKNPGFEKVMFSQKHIPLFIGRKNSDVLNIGFYVPEPEKSYRLKRMSFFLKDYSNASFLETISVTHSKSDEMQSVTGSYDIISGENNLLEIDLSVVVESGGNSFSIGFPVREGALLTESFSVEKIELHFEDRYVLSVDSETDFIFRPAVVVRVEGQDNCDTYRIPGIISTEKGTLVAVYDNRYNNSKDLQEDIDVGMSRSTDGGQTWELMRVIIDMGEWGGRPEKLNGVGDPAVLYDHVTGTIWVAGLWMSGATKNDMLWRASKPGMKPDETGQFILVKSTDDGKTWSEPVNITGQIKDPSWQLLLQGPGCGITLDDGTLVFPAQFKADIGKKAADGGEYTPHSTIIYSKDGGETWHIGTGAKPNTTEAQVVQLADGTLMLNMRDDLNRKVKDETNGRAVAVTSDLGKTWKTHKSSNSALQEPNCMASLISANTEVGGNVQQVLFFSNPDDKEERINMTIKASVDQGETWPEKYHVKLNENPGFGYSCLVMTDNGESVGILYEGVKELYFQKVPVSEILK